MSAPATTKKSRQHRPEAGANVSRRQESAKAFLARLQRFDSESHEGYLQYCKKELARLQQRLAQSLSRGRSGERLRREIARTTRQIEYARKSLRDWRRASTLEQFLYGTQKKDCPRGPRLSGSADWHAAKGVRLIGYDRRRNKILDIRILGDEDQMAKMVSAARQFVYGQSGISSQR